MKRALSIILAMLMVFSLCACGSKTEAAPAATPTEAQAAAPAAETYAEPVVTIKIGHCASADMGDPQQIGAYALKEALETMSNGYYKVEVYPANQLGTSSQMLESVQLGTLEMQEIENGACSGFVADTLVWDLPYLISSLEHAQAVYDSEICTKECEEFLNIGVRVLAYDYGGFRHFTNSVRPIVEPEDMKGLKMRVMQSEIMISTINAFGGNAVPMAFSELYTAMQQGTVDGQDNPASSTYNNSFQEVQKYMSLSGHFYFPRRYVVSEVFFQQQSPEHQQMITEAAQIAAEAQNAAYISTDQEFIDKLKAAGMEVNEVDTEAFKKIAIEQVWPEYYATLGGGDEAAGKALVDKILALDPTK